MRIGVTLPFGASDGPDRLPTWPEIHAFATHAEAVGLDSVWACDHFLSGPPGRPAEAIHEGWTIVAALAASTNRTELGQPVMSATFRKLAQLDPVDRCGGRGHDGPALMNGQPDRAGPACDVRVVSQPGAAGEDG